MEGTYNDNYYFEASEFAWLLYTTNWRLEKTGVGTVAQMYVFGTKLKIYDIT